MMMKRPLSNCVRGVGPKIPEGVVDLFQYVSSIHPDAPALPAYTPDQKLKILAGIGILADIFDAQMDVHRPYKTEQLRQGTLPAPAQMVGSDLLLIGLGFHPLTPLRITWPIDFASWRSRLFRQGFSSIH